MLASKEQRKKYNVKACAKQYYHDYGTGLLLVTACSLQPPTHVFYEFPYHSCPGPVACLLAIFGILYKPDMVIIIHISRYQLCQIGTVSDKPKSADEWYSIRHFFSSHQVWFLLEDIGMLVLYQLWSLDYL